MNFSPQFGRNGSATAGLHQDMMAMLACTTFYSYAKYNSGNTLILHCYDFNMGALVFRTVQLSAVAKVNRVASWTFDAGEPGSAVKRPTVCSAGGPFVSAAVCALAVDAHIIATVVARRTGYSRLPTVANV